MSGGGTEVRVHMPGANKQGCRGDWISIHIHIPFFMHAHRKPAGIPTESPYPQNPEILHSPYIQRRRPRHRIIWAQYLNKHSYAVHVTVLLRVFSNNNEENASERNHKVDCIWRNSNSDYDIYRVFNAFPLISHPFKNLHTIPTGLWGFTTVHIPIHYPYPWESPRESPYIPTVAL